MLFITNGRGTFDRLRINGPQLDKGIVQLLAYDETSHQWFQVKVEKV
jgi:hypothetical protein